MGDHRVDELAVIDKRLRARGGERADRHCDEDRMERNVKELLHNPPIGDNLFQAGT